MIRKARHHLCFLYIFCIFWFFCTGFVEMYSFTEYNDDYILYYYAIMAPLLAISYIVSLCLLFSYMNTEQNPALQPEHGKMAWQAFFYILSLCIFFSDKVYIMISSDDKP